jgi:hypothetical protein
MTAHLRSSGFPNRVPPIGCLPSCKALVQERVGGAALSDHAAGCHGFRLCSEGLTTRPGAVEVESQEDLRQRQK